jgi:hypothetical protein
MLAPVGRSGTELLTTVQDTGAAGITTPFGVMALERWQTSQGLNVGESFTQGVIDGAGLRPTTYNATEREAAAQQAAKDNRNIAIIAIMGLAGFFLATSLKGGN